MTHDENYPRPLGVIEADIARAKEREITLQVNAGAGDVANALGASLRWADDYMSWVLTPRDVLATLATLERERQDRILIDLAREGQAHHFPGAPGTPQEDAA
jgi:cystathionine beta-lyase family protein involved in aluminum resistance